jgi:N-methylhydantoinase A
VVFVNARLAAIGAVSVIEPERGTVASATSPAARSHRKAFFGKWLDVSVYALDDLKPGQALEGPAIVEAETTTVVINAGDQLSVNALGWLDIKVAKPRPA